jgi:hypothetical protein
MERYSRSSDSACLQELPASAGRNFHAAIVLEEQQKRRNFVYIYAVATVVISETQHKSKKSAVDLALISTGTLILSTH